MKMSNMLHTVALKNKNQIYKKTNIKYLSMQ